MRHLIEQAWEIYRHHTEKNGVEPDKFHWLCGVCACMGILNGTLPVGILPGTTPTQVMAQLQAELDKYRLEITALEDAARARTNRRNMN